MLNTKTILTVLIASAFIAAIWTAGNAVERLTENAGDYTNGFAGSSYELAIDEID